jgi:protein-S-isoprenylcysteine O-methyltransferase Ste14
MRRRKPTDRPLTTGQLVVANLYLLPLAATFAAGIAGAIYTKMGKEEVANGLCGPIAVLSAGITFAGAMLMAWLYGSLLLLESPSKGLNRAARVALTCLPFVAGIVLIVIGSWLLLRHLW